MPAPGQAHFSHKLALTVREIEAVRLAGYGLSNAEIAERMRCGERQVLRLHRHARDRMLVTTDPIPETERGITRWAIVHGYAPAYPERVVF